MGIFKEYDAKFNIDLGVNNNLIKAAGGFNGDQFRKLNDWDTGVYEWNSYEFYG